jgi:hypothetical protein
MNMFTGQQGSGFSQPIFNLSPFYTSFLAKELTVLPLVGGFFSRLPASSLTAVVNFIAGCVVIGALAFAVFMSLGKIIGYVLLFALGGVFFALFFGIIKL